MRFERTEDHHFTITTHTNQEVDLFHSLIFPTWKKTRMAQLKSIKTRDFFVLVTCENTNGQGARNNRIVMIAIFQK